jgi:hypothetical protein
MAGPENCASCPLQCQIAERIADDELLIVESRVALEGVLATYERLALQENIAWTQYGIDGLQQISEAAVARCQGPRNVLVAGVFYFDGQPRYERQCSGSVPDFIRRILS